MTTAGPAPTPTGQATQTWTSGAKDTVVTTVGGSHVWATVGQGIVNEIYWPAVDQPEVKDLGFLVAGDGWWREVKRVASYTVTFPDLSVPLPTVTHTGREPGQDYTLTLRPVVHPDHDVLLVDYHLQGSATHLYPLLAPHLQLSQVTPGNAVATLGADNQAWVDPSDRGMFAAGHPGLGRYLCLLAAPGFAQAGAGYVGDTDGWTDLSRNARMTLTYTQAGPGVVALTGDLAAGAGLLALGFGASAPAARAAAQAGLDAGYDATAAAVTTGWHDWAAGLTLPTPAAPAGLSDALRQSAVVLRCHADHTTAGAYVAGLATPWGQDTNAPDGYHLVWCRDGAQTALALAAAGHTDDASAVLEYLAGQQNDDGSWPRCFFVSAPADARADPGAPQLDEVAFPLLLAGKLDELKVDTSSNAERAIVRGARYLAAAGPVSQYGPDRWEENPGASPFTLGVEIVALLVAAARLTGIDQTLARDLADNWNERLEEFTYVSGDEIDQYFKTDGHYVRIGVGVTSPIALQNQPSDTPEQLDSSALVGLEFLYLPRLGLRDPADPRITATLTIAEAMLGADTASGRAYHRYDLDGYGEWLDGTGWPRRSYGIGRPWPLLTGERGHYDVLAGGTATAQLEAMLAMRGAGGLLPEQIWDTGALPWRNLLPGHPTGSAMPLAWAHSELIKLAITADTHRPVEQLALVTDRYPGAAVPQSARWFWRDLTPVRDLPAGRTLVVADTGPFTLHYGFDNWTGVTEQQATDIGLGLFGSTLTPTDLADHHTLQFVRRYSDGRWERSSRNDVALNTAARDSVRLSATHFAALAASGPSFPTP
jgi:glucoamylase